MRTSLRSVLWISEINGNPSELCLVGYKPDKLTEGPLVMLSVLALSYFGSLSYPLKFLQHYSPASTCGTVNNTLTYEMVDCSSEPSLPARNPLEVFLGRESAFRLKLASQPVIADSISLNLLAAELLTVRCGSKILNSKVNTNGLRNILSRWLIGFNNKVKVILAILDDLGAADVSGFVSEVVPLVLSEDKRNFLSASQCNEGSKLAAIHDELHASWWVKWKHGLVEAVLFGPVSFVGKANLILNANGNLGGEIEALPNIVVNEMVQGNPVEALSIPGNSRNIVQGILAHIKRLIQYLLLDGIRVKLALDSDSHHILRLSYTD